MFTAENLANQPRQTEGPKNPWYRFPKGSDNRVDKSAPNVRFRFLRELKRIPFSLSHWDDDIKKPVQCNRSMSMGKDGRIWLNGQCDYCDMRKAHKEAFVATKERPFCDNKWDLKVVLVAPVSILNDDDTQTFKLIALNAKDFLYKVAKGAYNDLKDFTDLKANSRKPSKLTDYWWEMNPEYKLFTDTLCEQEELNAEIEGFLDEDGNEFNLMQAKPFDYAEAIAKRLELSEADHSVEAYSAPVVVQEVEPVEAPKPRKVKRQDDSSIFSDDHPPF